MESSIKTINQLNLKLDEKDKEIARLTEQLVDNQKQQESTLNYFEDIISRVPGCVYWLDKNNIYLGCNNNLVQLLGLPSNKDIIGKTNYDLPWKDNAPYLNDFNNKVMKSGQSFKSEEIVTLDKETRTYFSEKVPLYDLNRAVIGLVGISIDITESKKLENELKKAKEQAEIANRAKTEFIANVSHDIRTPLTGVIGLSELLEQTLKNDTDKEKAHLLHDSGEELLHMLNEILDDVRAGNLKESDIKTESFDVRQCIKDLIRLELPTTTLKHLELKADISPDVPPYLLSDRNKIHRILLNLLGNAIKFTQTGSITLAIACLHNDCNKAHLKFSVSDTGIGIPEEVQAQVFNRFFKVSSSYKGIHTGHGLGLHIVQSYVTLLGGHITLTSKENVGTTFSFDIWCEKDTNKQVPPRIKLDIENLSPNTLSIPSKGHNPKPYTILLVEDNPTALRVLENMITTMNHKFISASDGETALSLYQSHQFDLIITDIGLPGISGCELTSKIRSLELDSTTTKTPIIGLTGHVQHTARLECLTSGMDEVITKPATVMILQSTINHILLAYTDAVDETDITGSCLSLELPDTEEELFLLDTYPLFDVRFGLEQINDMHLLANLAKDYVSDVIQNDIHKMNEAFKTLNWDEIENIAHKLKGGAAYIGIRRMFYACQYLERYHKAGNSTLLEPLYKQLLAVNSATVNAINQWIKQYL